MFREWLEKLFVSSLQFSICNRPSWLLCYKIARVTREQFHVGMRNSIFQAKGLEDKELKIRNCPSC